jgi:alkylated DNA repair dioxygenase AlkB
MADPMLVAAVPPGCPPRLAPQAEVQRIELDEQSWVDLARGWLQGAGALFEMLTAQVPWSQGRVFRYERYLDDPRLGAWYPAGAPPHAVLDEARDWLQRRYRVRFDGCALAWYRDGRDGVAFHRDREMRWLDETIIAVLTLGARRPFLLRPRAERSGQHAPGGGATHDLAPGAGDLIVMGGRCQAAWEHSVPRVPGLVAGRVSVQWRWTSRRGARERGPSYRAPRVFSREGRRPAT